MKKFWIVFAIVAVVIGGGLGLLWKLASSLNESAVVAEGGVLHWQAAGGYAEVPSDGFMARLQEGERATFSELVFGLRRAARDPDVDAILLDLRGLSVDWAQLEELTAAVRAFREGGKAVWAYVEFGGNADYALACAADRVVMAPEGNLLVLGVAAELAFFKDTLAKVGLEADFVHVGKYKSAPEQLTRSGPSEANREMMTALVDGRYDLLVDLIATGRDRDPREVRRWIDTGMFDAETALAAGLVDTLLDRQELLELLSPDEDVADLDAYVMSGGAGRATREVALVVVAGTIYPGESRRDALSGQVVGSDTVVEQLTAAREDDDIDAVLLRVDSPGGSALASDLIWREVARVRDEKPVVVSMGGYAASGGYYVACGADSIFAGAGTLTGSIGVFAGKMDWSGLYEKIGTHREYITRGENALLWRDAGPFTPAQRAMFQDQLDRFYERFLAKVGDGRGMDREAVHAVAQGRVWAGAEAVETGLIDGLGGLDRALQAVKRMVGAEPDERVLVRTHRKSLSWLERAMLDALRSRGFAVPPAAVELGGVPVPAHLFAALRGTMGAGIADVLPLLDGRPLALMPWREVPGQDVPAGP